MAENTTSAPPAKPSVPAVNVSPASARPPPDAPKPAPVETKPPEAKSEPPKPDITAQLEAREKELNKLHARLARERREIAEQRKAQKTRDDEVDAWKKRQELKRRNPTKFLEEEFGPNYYDSITKAKLEGSPPTEFIAAEVDERMASLQKQLEEKEAAFNKRFEDMKREEATRAKTQYLEGAKEFVKANADKFKALNFFEEFDAVPNFIESHFRETTKKDDEGNWVPGETLSYADAAERVEKKISDIAEKFREYLTKHAEQQGTTPTKRDDSTQRRDGNTPDGELPPPKDDAERWRRAMAAGERAMASRNH